MGDHLVGAPRPNTSQQGAYFNSALLVLPDGQVTGQYDKRRPLVFAETSVSVPGLCGSFRLHPSPARYISGTHSPALSSPVGVAGVNICSENFYPADVRRSVRHGAEFLINMSNDGWLAHDTPLRQHFLFNVLRAVENGRDTVVANNVGVSAIVDARGRIRATTDIRVPACLVGDIQRHKTTTPYSHMGDIFAYLCMLLSISLVPWKSTMNMRLTQKGEVG